MLIVIGILLMLVTVAVTVMPSATETRRIREASRLVTVYLSSARNRAMESGRPCGVTFHYYAAGTSPGFAMAADQCEVPPPYAGDNTISTASVTYGGGNAVSMTFSDGSFSCASGVPVRPGDLIQLNGQGPFYTVSGSAATRLTPPPGA